MLASFHYLSMHTAMGAAELMGLVECNFGQETALLDLGLLFFPPLMTTGVSVMAKNADNEGRENGGN